MYAPSAAIMRRVFCNNKIARAAQRITAPPPISDIGSDPRLSAKCQMRAFGDSDWNVRFVARYMEVRDDSPN